MNLVITRVLPHVERALYHFILNTVSCICPMAFGEFYFTPGKLIFQKVKEQRFST